MSFYIKVAACIFVAPFVLIGVLTAASWAFAALADIWGPLPEVIVWAGVSLLVAGLWVGAIESDDVY